MKLSDPTVGLKETALEAVSLKGESLDDYRAFWNSAAAIDARRAISDQDSDESFEHSGAQDSARLRPLLPADGSGRAIEIGCGLGRIVGHLAAHASEVVGVDISAEMVEQAQTRLAHLPNVRFVVGNGYDLGDFDNDSYDVVYSYYVLQHMPKTTVYNYFREALRVLKPGGAFAFQLPNLLAMDNFLAFNHFTQPYFVAHPYPMNFYTPVEIAFLLERAGFWVESIDDISMVVARVTGTPGVAPGVVARSEWTLGSTHVADPRLYDLVDKGWVLARGGKRQARRVAGRVKARLHRDDPAG